MENAETPLAVSSVDVIVDLPLILKRGIAQVNCIDISHNFDLEKEKLDYFENTVNVLSCYRYRWMPHLSWSLWPRHLCQYSWGLRMWMFWRLWKWIYDDEKLHGYVFKDHRCAVVFYVCFIFVKQSGYFKGLIVPWFRSLSFLSLALACFNLVSTPNTNFLFL